MNKSQIDFAVASALLSYDNDTGKLFWKSRGPEWFTNPGKNDQFVRTWNITHAGRETGSPDKDGYLEVRLLRHLFKAHRLAWLLATGKWPEGHIDHEDGDVSNNRIGNLRCVSIAENNRNLGIKSNNSSGTSGVNWCPERNKWAAYIYAGRTISLGRFESKDDAVAARKAAEVRFNYHRNHGRPLRKRRNPAMPPGGYDEAIFK